MNINFFFFDEVFYLNHLLAVFTQIVNVTYSNTSVVTVTPPSSGNNVASISFNIALKTLEGNQYTILCMFNTYNLFK